MDTTTISQLALELVSVGALAGIGAFVALRVTRPEPDPAPLAVDPTKG